MRRVALATLRHDRLRTVLLVVGLATSWSLAVVQVGLRRGFERASRAVPDHAGGDLWVTAKGVRVLDDGEPVARPRVDHRCIRARRPLVLDYTQARRPDGSLVTVQIVGVDEPTRAHVPWGIAAGRPGELATADGAGIDAADAEKLGLEGDGSGVRLGQSLELRDGSKLRIVIASHGARSFAQIPLVFVDVATARRLLSLGAEDATFWLFDLDDRGCRDEVRRALSEPTVAVQPVEALTARTTEHWIESSGIGLLLAIGTTMASLVGLAALAQSAATIVRTHAKELATVLALGARPSELAAFVAWQVGVVSVLAAVLGIGLAAAVAHALEASGLPVVVDARSGLVGLLLAIASTVVSAVVGARVLGRVDPLTVLQ